jgi:hypothetical protein
MQQIIQIDHAEITYYEDLSVSPEQKLVAAIIRRAVFDAYMYLDGTKPHWNNVVNPSHEQRQAYKWLISKSKKKYSFRWWCDLAHLDYTYLQKKISDIKYKLPKMQ